MTCFLFIGKLAQRANLTKCKLFNDHDAYLNHIYDEELEILGEYMIDENNLMLSYKFKDETLAHEGVQNVAIASFVTSYARIQLYSIIDEVERATPGATYYFDTDSLIYEVKNDEDVLKSRLKPYLGDLTSEVTPGYKITAGAFNGPKSYALKEENLDGRVKFTTKVKGFTLTAEALKDFNLDTMTTLALEYENDDISDKSTIFIKQFKIDTNPKTYQLSSRIANKLYKVTSDKRLVLPCQNETLPFGYK